jgi:hypothetical protein
MTPRPFAPLAPSPAGGACFTISLRRAHPQGDAPPYRRPETEEEHPHASPKR